MITTMQFNELKSELASIREQLGTKQPDEILTSKEVMKLLKISRNSYNRMKEEGTIKVYMLRGKLYSKRSEILQVLDEALVK